MLENSGTYAISYENISAIVSNREGTKLNYADRESLGYLLVHHQETIEELQAKGFNMLIPLQLGTIAGSKDGVIKILANGYDLIMDTLSKIEYLTEIDIAVTWADFSETLKYVANHPEIIELKESILRNPDTVKQLDQVKIGMLIQEKLTEKNKLTELKVLDKLSAYSLDIKMHELMNDQMITNSAFLITRSKQDKFEKTIDEIDAEFNGSLNIKMVGPLPCYSFYTLEVIELDPDIVLLAKADLGLWEATTEEGIKKAYHEKARLFHPDNVPGNNDTFNFNRIKNAYFTLQDYTTAVKQSKKDEIIPLVREQIVDNLVLVKLKN
jgi:hypothetical protein